MVLVVFGLRCASEKPSGVLRRNLRVFGMRGVTGQRLIGFPCVARLPSFLALTQHVRLISPYRAA
jgi:hypothetical protein